MNLYQAVEPNLMKLERRLAKEGIVDISDMDYEKYLRSVFWKSIKEWVMERDNHRCVVCGKENSRFCEIEVHHRSYDLDVMEGRNSDMLVSLCSRCHKLIEFHTDGRKRSCLHEKNEKYFELKRLHAEIENKRLPLQINMQSRKGGESFEVTYAGESDYLDFYSVESLMYGFVLEVYQKHSNELKIPMPFGRDKLYQKSGAKISNKVSGKEVINVKITNGGSVIKASRICIYPVYEYLASYISGQKYWYVIQ